MGKFFFAITSIFAEIEAELIRERVLLGLDVAKVLGSPVENKNIDGGINDYLNTNLSAVEIAKNIISLDLPYIIFYK